MFGIRFVFIFLNNCCDTCALLKQTQLWYMYHLYPWKHYTYHRMAVNLLYVI